MVWTAFIELARADTVGNHSWMFIQYQAGMIGVEKDPAEIDHSFALSVMRLG